MEGRPFWEQNLTLIKSRYPGLVQQLESSFPLGNDGAASPSDAAFFVEQTPSGFPTLFYRHTDDVSKASGATMPPTLLHSRHDPRKEGRLLAEAALAGLNSPQAKTLSAVKMSVVIVLGFGLGYTSCALAKALAAAEQSFILIIVERYTKVFAHALAHCDLQPLLEPGSAVFVLEESHAITAVLALLEKQLGQGALAQPIVVKHRALCGLTAEDSAWYADAEQRINTWHSKNDINSATLRRFGRRWTRNLAANMYGVRDFPGVAHLHNIFAEADVPVFLAAAGPSLNSIAPFLPEVFQRCVVVAVDTSLRFLLERQITPDFVVSVDPQYWNALHLFRQNAPGSALIAESAMYPAALRSGSFGRVFFCQSMFPLGRFIEDRCDAKGALGAGGSVATTAWDFSRLLGASAVWASGLDLAFPQYQTHFKGALFEENTHAHSSRFCPAETLSVQALESGIPFTAQSVNGESVLTDRRLSLYAAWFESHAAQAAANGMQSYNLSPNGLAISGFTRATPQELCALPLRRTHINSIVRKTYADVDSAFAADALKRTSRYTEALQSLVMELGALRQYAQDAAAAAENGLKCSKAHRSLVSCLHTLDTAQAAIEKSLVKDAAGFLFPPIAELEHNLHETEPTRRHLEFSVRFYQSLYESTDFTLRSFRVNV